MFDNYGFKTEKTPPQHKGLNAFDTNFYCDFCLDFNEVFSDEPIGAKQLLGPTM